MADRVAGVEERTVKIRDVTPFVLRGHESYGSHRGEAEATDSGDYLFLVRVRTDEGLEGWADAETLGPVAAAVISGESMGAMGFRTLSEILVDTDPLDISERWRDMYLASAYYGRRGVVMQCISAIDNCLWSIAAQAADLSLVEMLGGRRRDRLSAYASTLFRQTPEENAEAARRYREQGFRAVKFGWGGFGIDPGRDRESLQAIREALGPGRELMVDPGWYVEIDGRPRVRSRDETVTMLEVVAEVEPYWIEDFVHPERFDEFGALHREFPTARFAAGEQQATTWEFDRLLDEASLDVVQPDLSRCGGLSVALAVAERASASGIEFVTHSWLTDLLHAYSLHLLATLPTAQWFEFNVAQSELSGGIMRSRMRLEDDGTVLVPDGVGTGVHIDEDFVRARARSV